MLRAIEPHDLDLLYELDNADECRAVTSTPNFYSRHTLEQYLASQCLEDPWKSEQLRLAVTLSPQDTTAVGFIDLTSIAARERRAEVGLCIAPAYRRQGRAKAALTEMADFAHQHLNLHLLYAIVPITNTPSLHTFAAAGYQEVARLPEWVLQSEKYTTAAIFQRILG